MSDVCKVECACRSQRNLSAILGVFNSIENHNNNKL